MIPVYQDKFAILDPNTKTYIQRGSCFIACLASVLEFPIHAVPRFEEIYCQSNWRVHLQSWLAHYHLQIVQFFEPPQQDDDNYFIVGGKSPRYDGLVNHFCVWHKGNIVHDPHPENKGVVDPFRWQLIKPVTRDDSY